MKKYLLLASVISFAACNLGNKVSNLTEEVANKTATKAGKIIGGSTRSFADGVGEGLDKAGNSSLQLSEELSKKGIKLGGHKIENLSGNDNKLSVYFIFEQDFTGTVMVKVFNKQMQEVGRIKQELSGKKDDAGYIDFVFDERTNIDPKYTITIE
ncbi:hypothetical protein [Capnocytophaga gingivalis]|uniref:hypothetical protein n=1 Tax=Capnocytophaga gingivalis TaxID=1017 RepID=UPI003C7569B2